MSGSVFSATVASEVVGETIEPALVSSVPADRVEPKKKKTKISLVPSLDEISSILEEQKPKAPQIIEGSENKAFDMEALLEAWHSYIDLLKKDKKINVVTLLNTHAPRLNDTEITLLLDNKTQEQYFNDERVSLTNFLRQRLRNYSVFVKAEVIKAESQKKLISQQDFFNHLLEQNPMLQQFTTNFSLEFDTSRG